MNIDISRFCATEEDPRDYLRTPWIEDGKTIATNGHFIIMLNEIRTEGVMAGPHPKMVGRVAPYLQGVPVSAVVDTSSVRLDKKKCAHCKGSGYVLVGQCADCDGDGEFEHGKHTYTCLECEGAGTLEQKAKETTPGARRCCACCGTGHDMRSSTKIGACLLANRYLSIISGLPACKLHIPVSAQDPVHFDFTGGRGVLMPMSH